MSAVIEDGADQWRGAQIQSTYPRSALTSPKKPVRKSLLKANLIISLGSNGIRMEIQLIGQPASTRFENALETAPLP
jgi:hypothetical protein